MKYLSQHPFSVIAFILYLLCDINPANLLLAREAFPSAKLTKAYVKSAFVPLRQSSSEDGTVVTNISCGEEVQILNERVNDSGEKRALSDEIIDQRWQKVQFINQVGYVRSELLSYEVEPHCDSIKHSTFFWKLNLDIIDMSQWAHLEEKINRHEVK